MKQIFFSRGREIIIGILLTFFGAAFGNEPNQVAGKAGSAAQFVTHEESTVIEHALEHMLMRMAENNEEPTESILRLYQAVTEKTEIKIEDLNELLPVMLECMKAEQERAARPDAPDALGNGAISGCCGCCDLSQILAVLGSIQAKLVIINNLIVECCDEIRFDFQATWSILANLNVTATVDLNPVFSVIADCCNGTFSTLANLSFTAVVDLNPVFTALNACCNGTFTAINNVNNNVIATFSVLNQIIINQQGTFSAIDACCDGTFSAIADLKLSLTAIQVNFNSVFTALNACCNSTFSMLDKIDREVIGTFSVINACCNGTFSAIADLKLSLTAIQVNFNPVFTALNACCNGTFSMLNKIDTEVISTFSVLNTIIINEQGTFTAIAACCNGTFSAIADIKSSLTAITVNFNPVFTALNACCESTFSMLDKIDREVIGTFSVINACCNGTFSVLANLTVTATADLSGMFTALNACCEGTFSVLANLTVTATADLSGVFSALAACCDGTFSSLFDIKNTLTACGAIPIFTSTEITMSGNYCLANDIIGTITISSNEVHLDLNGFSIISTDTTGIAEIPTPPFIIQWGAISMNNVENVSVRNGQLYKLGIFASTCTNVLIDSIASFSCGVPDINCTGMNRLSVSNYSIFNHYGFSSCVSAELSNDISFENFNVNDSQYAQGFTIISIDNFEVENLFLNNPSTPSATINASSIAATSVTNLSIRNVITEAGAIFVVTSTGIIIENVQSSLSTNGFSFMNNVRNVSIADCICRDSDVVGGVLQNIVTGTNIRVSNFNVENCVGNEVILATDITNCVFENYNASECVLSAPAIVVDNTSSGTTTGAQLTFDNWTLNECALISVFNINTAPDIQISRFKVTNNNSLSSISFARVTNSPKVIFDDCIFSDNASNTADNIITAQASDFIRINNVVIENNTFAGGQNGIVFSAGVLLTVTGCEVTNCRIENNALNTSGIPVVSLNLIEATGVQSLNVSGNIINNNVINAVSASENIIIADSASTNATITKNTINSNMFNDGISSVASYINTSAVALIEDNIMIENSSSTGAAFGIQATSNAIVRGNVLNLNQCPLQMIGISVVGEDSVIEKNIVTRNIGSTSTGIQISASRGMVTMNESQQHTNNYITTGGLIIPIAELSYANGIIVPVPVDAPLSSYHNLSMVPQPLSYVSTFSLILELKDTLTVCGIPTPISSSTVITQSGTYCLTQDIVGTITINADNVILDMNNKQITGAVPLVISSHQNILVKNGRITSPGVGGQGIQISSCFDVTFDNILLSTITNTALSISSCENVQVTNCVFIGCVLPISIASSIDTMLKNCTLRDNTGRTTAGGPTSQTVLIIGSTGTVMDNCVLFNNTNYDTITAVSASTNTILQDSSWYSNSVFLQSGGSAANSPRIILSANSSNTVIERCEVNDNSAPVGGSNLYVINSLTGDRTCLIRHCTVARNTPGAAANLFGIAANGSGVVSKNTIFGNTYGAGSPIQTVAGAALIIQNKYDKPASGGVVAEYNYSTTVGVGGISQPPLSPFHNIVQV